MRDREAWIPRTTHPGIEAPMKRLPVLSLLPSLAAPLAEADWNAAFEARDAAGREAITRYKAAEMME